MDINVTLTTLLALSLRSETTSSRKIRQEMKMKAGKCRKTLHLANESSKNLKWGAKNSN